MCNKRNADRYMVYCYPCLKENVKTVIAVVNHEVFIFTYHKRLNLDKSTR